jgi:ABC-type transport system involved in multi-copper enzyme maturation permease subunit
VNVNPVVDNPVLNREIRGRMRFRRFRTPAWKVIWVIIALVVVRYYYLTLRGILHAEVDDATEIWRDVSYALMFLIALIAPAIAASAVSQEREQQTWDLLRITRLSGAQIILGKWLARQVVPAGILAFLVPVILVAGAQAQVGLAGGLSNVGYLALNCAFFSAIGLWCSYVVWRTPAATAVSLLLTGAICVGTVIVDMIIAMLVDTGGGMRSGLGTYTLWVNPFYALYIMDELIKRPSFITNIAEHRSVILISVATELAIVGLLLYSLIRRYSRSTVL